MDLPGEPSTGGAQYRTFLFALSSTASDRNPEPIIFLGYLYNNTQHLRRTNRHGVTVRKKK